MVALNKHSFEARFFARIDRNGPAPAHCPELGQCHLWTGGKYPKGYGDVWVGLNRKHDGAHRVAWQIANGPIPKKMGVLHRCDVRACVRPSHLFTGDAGDNSRDCAAKGRQIRPSNFGAKIGSSKLTDELVSELRASTESNAVLGRRLGLSDTTIGRARTGKTWKHVQ